MILSCNQTMNSIVYRRLRLRADYHLINSNHIFEKGSLPYLKHLPYQQQLEYNILHSDGGATLITGFRGVGKTTMVNNALDHISHGHNINVIAIPIMLSSAKDYRQVLVEIIRKLYESISDTILWSSIDASIANRILLAYKRTSYAIKQTNNTSLEADASTDLPTALPVALKIKGNHQRNIEKSFLNFSDNDAEYELTQCLKLLLDKRSHTKVVIVIDEIDKITTTDDGKSYFDYILGQLKNLVCSTCAHFLFVAGIDVYKRWEKDCQKINSLYSSIFTHHIYLPCVWDSLDELFAIIEDRQYVFKPIDENFKWMVQHQYTSILEAPFKMLTDFLLFKGKGLPQKIINAFNNFVTWDTNYPCLVIDSTQARAIQQVSKLMEKFYLFISSEKFGTIYERDLVYTLFLSMLDYLLHLEHSKFTQDDIYRQIVDQQGEMLSFLETKLPSVLDKFCDLSLIKQTNNEYSIIDDTILMNDQSTKTLDSDLVLDERPLIQSFDHPDIAINDRFHAQIKLTKSDWLIEFWHHYTAEKILADTASVMVFQVKKNPESTRHYALLYKDSKNSNSINKSSKKHDSLYMIDSYRLESPYFIDTHDFIVSGKPIASLRSAVAGYSLAHLIESKLHYHAIYSIMIQVLTALDNLHKQGYGNIRLTPDNIIICKDGSLKFVDLHDVYILNKSKSPQTFLIYSAPEVYYSSFTIKSDIFSAGILLLEMLLGCRLKKKTNNRYVDTHTVASYLNLSEKLKNFLYQSTAFSPAERFANTEEMIDNIKNCPEFRKYKNNQLPSIESSTVIGTNLNYATINHDLQNSNTADQSPHYSYTTFLGNAFFSPAGATAQESSFYSNIHAYLLHRHTNERISITKDNFQIGKDPHIVDFVPDSPDCISRKHAIIKYINGSFYITDCKSKNFTFVNEVRIEPETLVRICTGDAIRLADKEFIFYENG